MDLIDITAEALTLIRRHALQYIRMLSDKLRVLVLPLHHAKRRFKERPNRLALLLLPLLIQGCASQNGSKALQQYQIYQSGFQPIIQQSSLIQGKNQSLNIDPNWVAKVNQHLQADVDSVHVPYREAITAIENLSVQASCSEHAHNLVDRALNLNISSIRARYLQMYCEKDPQKKAQIKSDILAIAQVLLSTGSGESIASAIQIRELAEAYTLMSVLGWYVFDMELVVGKDERIGYKLHALSYERDQFQYVYFDNHTLLKKLYQSRTQEPLTNRKASLITMRSFMSEHESSALAFIARNLMHRKEYQELIDTIESRYDEQPLLSVLYAEALLKTGRNKEAAELLGHIDIKSAPGFVDGLVLQAMATQVIAILDDESASAPIQATANGAGQLVNQTNPSQNAPDSPTKDNHAQTDKKQNKKASRGVESVSFLLEKIDYLTEAHTGITLLIEQIPGHPRSDALLAFWLQHYTDRNVVTKAIIDKLSRMKMPVHQQEKLAILHMMQNEIPEAEQSGDIAWMLGQMHHAGEGVEKNIEQAFLYYRKAAEQGLPKAQTALGEIYYNGLFGFSPNTDIATRWLDLAIEQNHAPAKILKGNMLLEQVTKTTTRQAQALYREAIAQGQPRAYCELGMMYDNNFANVSVSQGIDLLTLGAEAGQAKCMFMLGLTYEVMQEEYEQSRKWYLRAIEAGSSAAMSNLGRHYDHGIGVEIDYAQALNYYQQAVKAGNIVANVNLGLMYEIGKGVPQDYQLAASFYSKAAKHGNAQALHNLGIMYAYGNHFARDLRQAFSFFDEAAAKGNAWSMFNVASAYRYGMGTNKNIEQAIHYFEQAAKQGIAEAFCKLSVLYHDYPTYQNLPLAKAYSDKANEYYGVNCAATVSVMLEDEQGIRHLVELSEEVAKTSDPRNLTMKTDTTLTQMADVVFKR